MYLKGFASGSIPPVSAVMSTLLSSKSTAPISRTSPEVITYRIGERLVYVKPAQTHVAAVQMAFEEFPEELYGISPHRITFTISATLNGEKRAVRISESAWSFSVTRMARGEVLNVVIAPESDRTVDSAPPPQYRENPVGGSLEASKSSSNPSKVPRPRPHWLRLLC
ncbi:hypothetical protein E1B28_010096 [Marasmius oreades]|uniref:Uncharacterized protein n=1 Tax=Marasmius oreades TaxID=181124 RepID=A0A9P7USC8_9AGAR|nr:uncharacterized protein E1B28_010096 [Marasmius oreades]KAG7091036.1 hypothetical protein E1B28_010096 [Marasmius oreades]